MLAILLPPLWVPLVVAKIWPSIRSKPQLLDLVALAAGLAGLLVGLAIALLGQ